MTSEAVSALIAKNPPLKAAKAKLEISAGFPFAYGRWRPTEEWLFEVNFQFPDFVGARVTYDFSPGWGVFGSLARRI